MACVVVVVVVVVGIRELPQIACYFDHYARLNIIQFMGATLSLQCKAAAERGRERESEWQRERETAPGPLSIGYLCALFRF